MINNGQNNWFHQNNVYSREGVKKKECRGYVLLYTNLFRIFSYELTYHR